MSDAATAPYHSPARLRAALLAMSCAVGMIGADELPAIEYSASMDPVLGYGYGPRGGTPSRGKVRDTKAVPKARKRDRRSPRHTQRRRR